MKLTYTPEGADPQSWRYEPEKLLSSEAIAIEKATGWSYEEFGMHLVQRAILARRALLWVLLKRSEPTLRLDQLDPPVSAIELEYDVDELREFRAEAQRNEDLSESERRGALEFLDAEIEKSEAGEDGAPKDQSESSDVTPISGPSLTSFTSAPARSTA